MVQRIGLLAAPALMVLSVLALPVSAQTTRGCNLPPDFPCPTARIMDFSADRTSINAGESVVLRWAAENPGPMAVTPVVGVVVARGATRITPAATTTYTLSVGGGPNGETLTRTLTITVAGSTPGAAAVAPAAGTPRGVPRMPDGKPMLQGVFNARPGGPPPGPGRGGPPPQAQGRGRGGPPPNAAAAPGGLPTQPTLKPGMESYRLVRDDRNEVISDCVPGSVPPSFGPYSFQIVQSADYIVMMYEYMHLHRIVPLDGGPHQPGVSWMGDSVGHWEGDTLVVDTVGFNTQSTVGGSGDRHRPFRHSEELHMVERIRRLDYNTLEIETTLEDPTVFVGPWRTVSRLLYHPEFKKVEEYICAENTKTYDYLVDPTKEIKLR